jgi:Na+/melibiose symporter-like transporter
VPRERLGSYFAQRMFWGGSFGAVSGLLVRQILDAQEPGVAFVILFALAGVVCSSGYALFASIREPDVPLRPMPSATPVALLRQGLGWFRTDPIFRRIVVARSTLSVWLTASPFVVLFAVRDLGGGAGAAGTFLMARVAGFVLSNLGWHPLSKRRGNRAVLRVATAAIAVLSLAAVSIALLSPRSFALLPRTPAIVLLEVVSLLGGAAQSGVQVATAASLIELAPRDARQGFVSMVNTFHGPTMLLPLLGGLVVDATNAPTLFALCAGAALVGSRAAARLPTRPAAETTAPSEPEAIPS